MRCLPVIAAMWICRRHPWTPRPRARSLQSRESVERSDRRRHRSGTTSRRLAERIDWIAHNRAASTLRSPGLSFWKRRSVRRLRTTAPAPVSISLCSGQAVPERGDGTPAACRPRCFLELRNHSPEFGGELPGLEWCERVGQGAVVPQGRLLRDIKPFPYSLTYGAVIREDRAGVVELVSEHDQARLAGRLAKVLEVALLPLPPTRLGVGVGVCARFDDNDDAIAEPSPDTGQRFTAQEEYIGWWCINTSDMVLSGDGTRLVGSAHAEGRRTPGACLGITIPDGSRLRCGRLWPAAFFVAPWAHCRLLRSRAQEGNSKRDATMRRVALRASLGPTSVLQAFTPLPLLESLPITCSRRFLAARVGQRVSGIPRMSHPICSSS